MRFRDAHKPNLFVADILAVAQKHGVRAELDADQKLIWQNEILATDKGNEIILTTPERTIFTTLASRPNEQISYEKLIKALSKAGYEINNPTHFRVILHRLRKKLGANSSLIQTERENGYSLRSGHMLDIR
jgi:DNA-binding response OmpR family regulator